MTAWIAFCNATREAIRDADPSLTMVLITKVLSERWKVMTEEDKKPFVAIAAKDKQRYREQLSVYEAKQEYEHSNE